MCWLSLAGNMLEVLVTLLAGPFSHNAPQHAPCYHPGCSSFIPKTFLAIKSANPYSFPHLSVGQMKSFLHQAQLLSYSHSGKQSVPHFSLLLPHHPGSRGQRLQGSLSTHRECQPALSTQDTAMRLPVQEKGNRLTYWQRS